VRPQLVDEEGAPMFGGEGAANAVHLQGINAHVQALWHLQARAGITIN
jgi:hypothetical protein